MKYFSDFKTNDLLKRIGRLTYQEHRLALLVQVSRLISAQPARDMNMLVSQLMMAPYSDALEVYLLPNRDVVIFVLSALAPDVLLRDVCHVFADDPLAQTPRSVNGNALCSIHHTTEEIMELHAQMANLLSSYQDSMTMAGDADDAFNHEKFFAAASNRGQRPRLSVLIVEDQRFSRKMLLQILESSFEVLEAGEGPEALKLYETHAPDIVFLDIDLPGMNGFEILKRTCAVDRDAFIVMLTASNTAKDVQDAVRNGAQGFITKPFTQQKIAQYFDLFRKRYPWRTAKAS